METEPCSTSASAGHRNSVKHGSGGNWRDKVGAAACAAAASPLRARVVLRDAEGCIWLDRAQLRRRQWRLGIIVCGAIFAIVAVLWTLLEL